MATPIKDGTMTLLDLGKRACWVSRFDIGVGGVKFRSELNGLFQLLGFTITKFDNGLNSGESIFFRT